MGPEQPTFVTTEIESPDYLQEGQNIYDQPPFNDIISQISERTQLPLTSLRFGLSHISAPPDPIGTKPETLNAQRERWKQRSFWSIKDALTQRTRRLSTLVYDEVKEIDQYKEMSRHEIAYQIAKATFDIADNLERFPLWNNYLAFKTSSYNTLGEYQKGNKKVYIPEKTYVTWLNGQQRSRSKDARLWGIREIFGDQQEPIEHARASGKGPVARRFQIQKRVAPLPR